MRTKRAITRAGMPLLAFGFMLLQCAVPPDFFEGFDVSGDQLNLSTWTSETGAPSFTGRTQLREWPGALDIAPFLVRDGTARLCLSTFNPTGFSLYGSHAKTLRTFLATSDTDYELTARIRILSLQPGIVWSLYFYGCTPGQCASIHDEIDIEIVSNYLQPGESPRIQLNRYAGEPLGAGHGRIVDLPAGFNPLDFHEWTIRWGKERIRYLVDGIELFTTTSFVPQGPMQANIIVWGPESNWAGAYSSALQPARRSQSNQEFCALVDYVSAKSSPPQR